MQTVSFRIVAAALLLAACSKKPAPAAAAAPRAAVAEAPAPVAAIRGAVAEKIDVASYSYLRVKAPGGDVWAAVPRTDKKVGDTVAVGGAMWMENFKSDTLGRTWSRIAFGTLESAAPAAPGPAESFAQLAATNSAELPAGHPPLSAPADVGAVKVAKVAGAQGRTISDVWAHKAQLKDHRISVRGKVVKATNGVMGKNWLHLRDGTGEGPSADLAVATAQTAAVGDVVVVSGTVHLDRDLGAGYHYDVIVEDAQVKAE
jgi:starvation-inducible outer membrane lipoprotein